MRGGQGLDAQLQLVGEVAAVLVCDSADACDTNALFSNTHLLTGLLHAAGVGDQGLKVTGGVSSFCYSGTIAHTGTIGPVLAHALLIRGGGSGVPNASISVPTRDDILALLVCTGEGAHSVQTDVASLKMSPIWPAVEATVQRCVCIGRSLDEFLASHLGEHAAPSSPLVTTVINMLNASRWQGAGYEPRLALGHSIGEVAAGYVSGMLTIEAVLSTARVLGQMGAERAGAMVHAQLSRAEVDSWSADDSLSIAAVNGSGSSTDSKQLRVTLCGPSARVHAWMATRPEAKLLTPPHPWHHPSYLQTLGVQDGRAFARLPEGCHLPEGSASAGTTLISCVRAQTVERLDAAYWREWLTTPVKLLGALEYAVSHPTACLVLSEPVEALSDHAWTP